MCRIVVTNQLYLGNRMLGFEAYSLPKGEVVEFTEKQLKDMIKQGKSKVFGMKLDMATGNLIMDTEGFFVRNMMKKIHINSLVPMYEDDCMANIFYIVIGTRKIENSTEYEVISSRYEHTYFSEEKLKAMYDMGFISAGVKITDGVVTIAEIGIGEEKEDVTSVNVSVAAASVEETPTHNNNTIEKDVEQVKELPTKPISSTKKPVKSKK